MFGGFGRMFGGFAPLPDTQGAPTVPGMPMQAPRKGGGWRNALDIVGSTLREAGGEDGQLQGVRDRMAAAEREQQLKAFRQTLPPEQQQVFDLSPDLWVKQFGMPKEDPRPDFHYGPNGEFTARDPRTGAVITHEAGTPPPEKPGGKWVVAGGNWYWAPDDPSQQPQRGPAISAPPKTFAPPRKPSGGGAGGAAGMSNAELLAIIGGR